jgi:hypothetical protein
VNRSAKTGKFVWVAKQSNSDSHTRVAEKEIRSFYSMTSKQAAQTVKRSGVLTANGKLKPVYK